MQHHVLEWPEVANKINAMPDWHNTVTALKTSHDGLVLPPKIESSGLPKDIPTGELPPAMRGGAPAWLSGLNGKLKKTFTEGAAAVTEAATDATKSSASVADAPAPVADAPASVADAPVADAPAVTEGGKDKQIPADDDAKMTKQEVVGNIFTYVYLFLACVGILAAVSMVLMAYLDVSDFSNYKRVLRPDENMLLFKDTIEQQLLTHSYFNVFTEAKGSLDIVMSMGIHMTTFLMIQVILTILIKVALDGGEWSDATKAFGSPYFMIILVLYAIQLLFAMVYYYQLNRKVFEEGVLKGVFRNKINSMNGLRTYITNNLYNGADNITFYNNLVASVHDHGRRFRKYLAENARTRKTPEGARAVARMMFTFNVFNFYIGQYNTVENFIGTPMYTYFAGSPAASPDIDILQHINVLAINAGGMVNIFTPNQVSLWYRRMYPDAVQRKIALSNSWENKIAADNLNRMMSIANTRLASTMMEFNWTQYMGAPSNIYKSFRRFLRLRLLYWTVTQFLVLGLIGGLMWTSLSGGSGSGVGGGMFSFILKRFCKCK